MEIGLIERDTSGAVIKSLISYFNGSEVYFTAGSKIVLLMMSHHSIYYLKRRLTYW